MRAQALNTLEYTGPPSAESPLQAANERLTIPTIWEMLRLPGRPRRFCRHPLGESTHE